MERRCQNDLAPRAQIWRTDDLTTGGRYAPRPVTDVLLQMEAPSRAWAERVATVIEEALGDHGTVHLALPGESSPNSNSGYIVSGFATCDLPETEALDTLGFALAASYVVMPIALPERATKIMILPRRAI